MSNNIRHSEIESVPAEDDSFDAINASTEVQNLMQLACEASDADIKIKAYVRCIGLYDELITFSEENKDQIATLEFYNNFVFCSQQLIELYTLQGRYKKANRYKKIHDQYSRLLFREQLDHEKKRSGQFVRFNKAPFTAIINAINRLYTPLTHQDYLLLAEIYFYFSERDNIKYLILGFNQIKIIFNECLPQDSDYIDSQKLVRSTLINLINLINNASKKLTADNRDNVLALSQQIRKELRQITPYWEDSEHTSFVEACWLSILFVMKHDSFKAAFQQFQKIQPEMPFTTIINGVINKVLDYLNTQLCLALDNPNHETILCYCRELLRWLRIAPKTTTLMSRKAEVLTILMRDYERQNLLEQAKIVLYTQIRQMKLLANKDNKYQALVQPSLNHYYELSTDIAIGLSRKGDDLLAAENWPQAISHYLKAVRHFFDAIDHLTDLDYKILGHIANQLAVCYYRSNQIQPAYQFLKHSITYYQKSYDKSPCDDLLRNMITLHLECQSMLNEIDSTTQDTKKHHNEAIRQSLFQLQDPDINDIILLHTQFSIRANNPFLPESYVKGVWFLTRIDRALNQDDLRFFCLHKQHNITATHHLKKLKKQDTPLFEAYTERLKQTNHLSDKQLIWLTKCEGRIKTHHLMTKPFGRH